MALCAHLAVIAINDYWTRDRKYGKTVHIWHVYNRLGVRSHGQGCCQGW